MHIESISIISINRANYCKTQFFSTLNSIFVTPTKDASTRSPALTGPTPDGVPVKITSPDSSLNLSLIQLIRKGIVKIISRVFPSCLTSPLTVNFNCTLVGSAISSVDMNLLIGQDVSKPLARDHGRPLLFNFDCRPRSVISRAKAYPPT